MDRRTLVAVALSLLVYFAWMQWVGGPPSAADAASDQDPAGVPVEPLSPTPPIAQPAPGDAPGIGPSGPGIGPSGPGIGPSGPGIGPSGPGIGPSGPGVVPSGPVETGTVTICGADLAYTTDGGRVTDITLDAYRAPFLSTPIWTWVLGKFTGASPGSWLPYGEEPGAAHVASGNAALFAAGAGALDAPLPQGAVVDRRADGVEILGLTSDGVEVRTRIASAGGDPCVASLEVTWRNTTSAPYSQGVWLGLHDAMPTAVGRYTSVLHPYAMVDGSVETKNNLAKLLEPEPFTGPVDWLALADRYFTVAVVPSGAAAGTAVLSPVTRGAETLYGLHYRVPRTLAPGEQHTESFRLYVGPLAHDVLTDVAPGLRSLVQLGWFAFFGRILLWLLHGFHGVIGNWGLSIVALTLLVKGIFFPLTQASFKSSQAMQALSPELTRIREQFKDNPEELNRKTLALFRENGVNPLSGCLPMLVQLPVWISLYNVLLTSVDLYHVPFLYLRDLSVPDPYGALPLVVVVLMAVQQQFMPTGNMDPMQARMMKIMPIVFGVFFFTFPSGLVVYIFVNMILTILQQWWIKRRWAAAHVAA